MPDRKPLVVPNMTWDVGVHGFVPTVFEADGTPSGRGAIEEVELAGDKPSGVWCPCIYHGHRSAEAARRLGHPCHSPGGNVTTVHEDGARLSYDPRAYRPWTTGGDEIPIWDRGGPRLVHK